MLAEDTPDASRATKNQAEKFRETIRGKIGNPYPSNLRYAQYIGSESVLGGVVNALINGRHKVLPSDEQMIEPIPNHGVTFLDPNFDAINVALESDSLIRKNLGYLVASMTQVDRAAINDNLAHPEEFVRCGDT